MRKLNERKLTAEVERKARELANTVAASSSSDEGGFDYEQIILKACRKSVIDGFPLQDYFLWEVPNSDKTGVLVYFENINEKRGNCFDAVYRLEHPQKGRRTIRKIIPKIVFNFRPRPYKRYFENLDSKPHIKILAIADLHDWSANELELIRDLEYDCCCLLGDIPDAALEIIKRIVQKPLFGVLGNHDELNTLSRCGIPNLDGKSVTVNSVTIAGFGGSHRYKSGDYPMLTQKESIAASKLCPKADILISHDTAYHAMKRRDSAHCGLKGISKYIAKNKPGLNICGHYHISDSERRLYKWCDIQCIYRCAIVTFPENTMKVIF